MPVPLRTPLKVVKPDWIIFNVAVVAPREILRLKFAVPARSSARMPVPVTLMPLVSAMFPLVPLPTWSVPAEMVVAPV